MFTDNLFFTPQSSIYGQFVPRAFILKTFTMEQNSYTDLLSFQAKIRNSEWSEFGVLMAISVITTIVGGVLMFKWLKARKLAQAEDRQQPTTDEENRDSLINGAQQNQNRLNATQEDGNQSR